jgi:hypothetical protein
MHSGKGGRTDVGIDGEIANGIDEGIEVEAILTEKLNFKIFGKFHDTVMAQQCRSHHKVKT